jgi:outer membrane lipase/esterase
MDWGRRGGSFDQTDTTPRRVRRLVRRERVDQRPGELQPAASTLDREVQLGPATAYPSGSPDGATSPASNAGWDFTSGNWRPWPVASVAVPAHRRRRLREETPPMSTSLAYPDQTFNSLIGSLGWQGELPGNDHLQPYAA